MYLFCLTCALEWTWKWKSQHCDGVLHDLFIKLNVTVVFLLIMKTWDELFAGKVGDGDFKKWGGGGNPSNGWWFGKGGGLILLNGLW